MQPKYFFILSTLIIFSNVTAQVNLKKITKGKFPVVSIKLKNLSNLTPENDHKCTGTLVSKRDVLTLEECSQYFNGKTTEIVVGSLDIRNGTKFYSAWWITYDQWVNMKNLPKEYLKNDIAMIRLKESVSDNEPIAKLSTWHYIDFFGQTVKIIGFAKKKTGGLSRFMESFKLEVISKKECEMAITAQTHTEYNIGYNNMCCVTKPNAVLPEDNNGSPVFHNDLLMGIYKKKNSAREIMCNKRKMNMIVSIAYYSNFVYNVIHHVEQPPN